MAITEQMFADSFVIERGNYNRSYFVMFIDVDKVSWTKSIYNAQRYSNPEQARATIAMIKARLKGKAA